MERILSYGIHMIPYMLCAFPVIFLYRWLRVRGLHKRGRHTTWRHELAFCVFLLFLAGLASQTVVPRLEFGVGGLAIMGGGQTGLRINLIPFRIFADSLASGTGYFIINFLGNIGMFLPIGFFTALLWERPSFLKSAGAGFFTSLTIELCQLPLDRGRILTICGSIRWARRWGIWCFYCADGSIKDVIQTPSMDLPSIEGVIVRGSNVIHPRQGETCPL